MNEGDIRLEFREVRRDVTVLKWMVGSLILMLVAVLWRVFTP